MKWLEFSYDTCSNTQAEGYPWVYRVRPTGAATYGPSCPKCGSESWPLYRCPMVAPVTEGRQWADIIGVGCHTVPFLVSQRVVDALLKAGAKGFEHFSVTLDVQNEALMDIATPTYYYLNILGRMDIDLKASGLGGWPHCPVCFRGEVLANGREAPLERFVPLPDTWDGSDLFQLRNYPIGTIFCTDKVVELARKHRWTNFRFVPMDTVHRHALGWSGIDYLGPQWPPKWYPDPPEDGNSLEEWIQELCSEDGERRFRAVLALDEMRQEAVPAIAPLLSHTMERIRLRAANMLLNWREEGIDVPEETVLASAAMYVDRLGNPEPEYRLDAARSLWWYQDQGVVVLPPKVAARVQEVLREFGEA